MSELQIMLDTNIVSDFMRYPEGVVGQRLRAYGIGRVCISAIVLAELRYGIVRSGSGRLARQMSWALEFMQIMPFDIPADRAYAEIRSALEGQGRPIGPMDMLIAAHALALDVVLVTANVREFTRVPDLRVENWLD
ncbi:type II toxin-antitoxin system VapC family toxin [Devosia sp. YIM 151766]|uniref:type II toxin-antitoxin system VapC family toxin n=1 Tax=Devosia sp. YIM 151766 TaxID=3017325 RepID=UPI00255C7F53|nr:type II toxin-antitoxin system VapC family toxin [Devosia sp. YIM 151766]WIY53546.1 type II toxin-antitoxin system VapC family toxin [Devosia sp. YIM 151766]